MSTHKNLITLCFAAVLTLGLAACGGGGGGGDDAPVTSMPDTPDMNGDEPELTELEKAQAAAAAAAADAMTAAGNANTAATAAETAQANAATLQTDETSGGLAEKARTYAGMADTAYMDAKAASEAAAAADNVTDAVRGQVMAEDARDAAQAAEMKAAMYGQDSEDATGGELMIVDTVKRVGGTSLDATAAATQVVDGLGDDAQTTRTGLLAEIMQPMAMDVGAKVGVTGVQDDPDTADDETIKHVQAVEERTFPIGKLVDSADDTARLMIVIQYAGSKNAYVYNQGLDTETGTKAGYLTIDDSATAGADVNNVALKSEGTFYPAGVEVGNEGSLDDQDLVADDAKGVEVFSYTVPDGGAKKYVVWTSEMTDRTTTTTTYNNVDVEVTVLIAGDAEAFETRVRAVIPEATDYKHIHFGVWAALGEAEADGSQDVADLGIGFLQNYSGEGLTGADMPNNGDAKYEGNWAATVRKADEDGNGAVTLRSGPASLMADFEEYSIEAELTGLATLTGDIAGNTFSGDEASDISVMHGLDDEGKFTGSFSGGFYGAKAAEAGGVFAFTSEDQEAGEFSGAFGADRK